MRLTTFLLLLGFAATVFAAPRISIIAVPKGGVTPDAEIDGGGTSHLVYAVSNNVFYAKSSDDGVTLSAAVRVNSEPDCSHSGMFRGPDIAVGKDGRAHVIWYSNGYVFRSSCSR